MNMKIVRKIASILMVTVIMSSALGTPAVNIGKVIASTTEDAATTTQQSQDTSTTTTADTGSTTDTSIESETSIESDTSTEIDVSVEPETSVEPDTSIEPETSVEPDTSNEPETSVEPDASIEPETSVEPDTSSSTDKSSANDTGTTTTKTTTEAPSAKAATASSAPSIDTYAYPTGTCVESQNQPPHLTSVTQLKDQFGNNTNGFTIEYNGGGGEPVGYKATYVTFYVPSAAGDPLPSDIILGPVEISDNPQSVNYFDFRITNNGATTNFTVPVDNMDTLINNMKSNGQIGLKYVVTYQKIGAPNDCIVKVSDTKQLSGGAFVPTFTPITNLAPSSICGSEATSDSTVQFTYTAVQTNYPTGAKLYLIIDPVFNGNLITSEGSRVEVPWGTNQTYNHTLTTDKYGIHDYALFVDLYADPAMPETYNPHSNIINDFQLKQKPDITSLTAVQLTDTNDITVTFGVNYHLYPATPITITIDGAGGSSRTIAGATSVSETFTNLGGGTHRITVSTAYGNCTASTFIDKVVIPYVPPTYPAPEFELSPICSSDCTVSIHFNETEPPYPGVYPGAAQRVLIVDPVFTNGVLTSYRDKVVIPTNVADYDYLLTDAKYIDSGVQTKYLPHTYYVYVDLNGDATADPVGAAKPNYIVNNFDLDQRPYVTNFALTQPADTLDIKVEFDIDFHENTPHDVIITVDDNPALSFTVDASEIGVDGKAHIVHTFTNFAPGEHSVVIDTVYGDFGDYGVDGINCPFTETFSIDLERPEYNAPSFTVAQNCSKDCTAVLTFSPPFSGYPDSAELVLLIDRKVEDGVVTYADKKILSIDDLVQEYTFESPLFNDTTKYAEHDYYVYVDIDGDSDTISEMDAFNPHYEVNNVTLYKAPIVSDPIVTRIEDSLDVNVKFDITFNTAPTDDVVITLDGETITIPASSLHIGLNSIDKTFSDINPGNRSLVITTVYGPCPFTDTTNVTIDAPSYDTPSFELSPYCEPDCKVNIDFTDTGDYPTSADRIVLIDPESDGNGGYTYFHKIVLHDENADDVDYTFTTSKHLSHEYLVYVDIDGDSPTISEMDAFNPKSDIQELTLQQKPDITIVSANQITDTLDIEVKFNINFHNYQPSDVTLTIPGEDPITILASELHSGMNTGVIRTFHNVHTGSHDISISTDFGLTETQNCNVTEVIEDVLVEPLNFPIPEFSVIQICEPDCIARLTFGNNGTYPSTADLVVLVDPIFEDGEVISQLDKVIIPTSTPFLDYDFSEYMPPLSDANIYKSHTYYAYVDIDGDDVDSLMDEFNPASEVHSLVQYKRPVVSNLEVTQLPDSIDAEVTFNLNFFNSAPSDINITIDGKTIKVPASELVSGENTITEIFPYLSLGEHDISINTVFGVNCPFTDTIEKVVNITPPEYVAPEFSLSRFCDSDCTVRLDFETLFTTGYPDDAQLVVVIDPGDGENTTTIVRDLPVSETYIDYTFTNDEDKYIEHTYMAYIDLDGDINDTPLDAFNPATGEQSFTLYKKPDITNLLVTQVPNSLDVKVSFDINFNGYAPSDITIDINDQNMSSIDNPIIIDGDSLDTNVVTHHIERTFKYVTPGSRTIVVNTNYATYDEPCNEVATEDINVQPPRYETPRFDISPICESDCTARINLEDIADYTPPTADSDLVIVYSLLDGTKQVIKDFDLPLTDPNKLYYDIVFSEDMYDPHLYSIYIDIDGYNDGEDTPLDAYNPTSGDPIEFTLHQKPDILDESIMFEQIADTIDGNIKFDIDFKDYAPSDITLTVDAGDPDSPYEPIIINAGALDVDNDGIVSIDETFNYLTPGAHTITVETKYGEDECPFLEIIDVNIIEPNYTIPSFDIGPVCKPEDDCTARLDFSTLFANPDTSDYPDSAQLVVVINPGDGISETKIVRDLPLPADKQYIDYTFTNNGAKYIPHNYIAYVDIDGDETDSPMDAFNPTTETTSFTLKQSPIITNVLLDQVNDSIDVGVDFQVNFNDYAPSNINVTIDEPDPNIEGSTSTTIAIPGNIAEGTQNYHTVFKYVSPGPHNVTVSIDFGTEEYGNLGCDTSETRPIVVEAPNFAEPEFSISPICESDCTTRLNFGSMIEEYPNDAQLVIEITPKDGNVIDGEEDITRIVKDLPLDPTYIDYEFMNDADKYTNHIYSAYVDLDGYNNGVDTPLDAFNPYSEPHDLTLLQKPIVTDFIFTQVDDSIDANVKFNINFREHSPSDVIITLDGQTITVPAETLLAGEINAIDETFNYVTPGEHTVSIETSYGRKCTYTFTEDIEIITPVYAQPTLFAAPICLSDCTAHLTFTNTNVLQNMDKANLVVLIDPVLEEDDTYSYSDKVVLSATAKSTDYLFTLESLKYINHDYLVYLDIDGDETDSPMDAFNPYSEVRSLTLFKKPEILTFNANDVVDGNKLNTMVSLRLNGNPNLKVSAIIDGGAPVPITLSEVDGIGTGSLSRDLEYGNHTVQLLVEYGKLNETDPECSFLSERILNVPIFPAPTITTKQDCTNDCKVDLSFGLEAISALNDSQADIAASSTLDNSLFASVASTFDYPDGSIMIVKRDGVIIYSGAIVASLSDVVPAYNTGTSLHTYTVQIAYNGSVTNPFGPTNSNTITLYKMAEVTNPMAYISNGRLHTSFDINLFSDPNAKVAILLDGETFDVTNFINSGHVVYDLEVAPGEHTVDVVINAITGCVITIPLTVYSAAPEISAKQDCDNDCKVDLSFATEGLVYPEGTQMVVMRGDETIYEGDVVSSLIDIVPAYNTNSVTYNYSVEIMYGGEMEEPFGPTSSLEFTLLKKPEIKSVEMTANKDMTLTIDYESILNGYLDATGTLVITGSNGYTKTIDIDSMDLLSGSFTTEKLDAGTYDATFTISYSESCEPIVLEAEPVKIEEPKLVYTGLESNLFETIIIEIKEIFVNAA